VERAQVRGLVDAHCAERACAVAGDLRRVHEALPAVVVVREKPVRRIGGRGVQLGLGRALLRVGGQGHEADQERYGEEGRSRTHGRIPLALLDSTPKVWPHWLGAAPHVP